MAGVLAALVLALTLATSGRARSESVHTCSGPDRQFIEAARTNMTALELWSEQFQSGEASKAELVAQAKVEARIMRGTRPTDFSLQQTRQLMVAMLSEYAKAIQLHTRHRDSGAHMYRAYGLANFAHTVLVRAKRPLGGLGCDVRPLL